MILKDLFGNRELVNLIEFFITNSSKESTQTEIINKSKISKVTIIKHIDFLVQEKLVFLRKIGTSNLYKLNIENVLVKEIKRLNTIIQLQSLSKIDAEEIYVYGSSARGENFEESDIDLLIIGKIDRKRAIESLDQISKKINKDINFQIFTRLEWSQMAKKDKPFYERVEKDKIRIK